MIVAVACAVVLVWLLVRVGQGAPETGGLPGAQRSPSQSVTATDPVSGLAWIDESTLPPEAEHTLRLISARGPFPYPRSDNQTFQNREGLLPREPLGYYKEFTVITPGSGDRGPRRIITGARGELYWTADHYASFSRIKEGP